MKNKLEEIKDEEMISFLKRGLDKIKSQTDSLYVLPSEFYTGVENVTNEERVISNEILSMIGTSKNDEELIELNIRPNELFDLLVNLQRRIRIMLDSLDISSEGI